MRGIKFALRWPEVDTSDFERRVSGLPVEVFDNLDANLHRELRKYRDELPGQSRRPTRQTEQVIEVADRHPAAPFGHPQGGMLARLELRT